MEQERIEYRDKDTVVVETFSGYDTVELSRDDVVQLLHGFDEQVHEGWELEQDNVGVVSILVHVRMHDGWWTDDGRDHPEITPDFSQWTDKDVKDMLQDMYPATYEFLASGGVEVSVHNPQR